MTPEDSPTPPTLGPVEPPPARSSELLRDGVLRIEHQGAVYTLRATSKGGLILTK
ncbi:MAG: hemin uptake protein HemP [Burkholderiales bacterium]